MFLNEFFKKHLDGTINISMVHTINTDIFKNSLSRYYKEWVSPLMEKLVDDLGVSVFDNLEEIVKEECQLVTIENYKNVTIGSNLVVFDFNETNYFTYSEELLDNFISFISDTEKYLIIDSLSHVEYQNIPKWVMYHGYNKINYDELKLNVLNQLLIQVTTCIPRIKTLVSARKQKISKFLTDRKHKIHKVGQEISWGRGENRNTINILDSYENLRSECDKHGLKLEVDEHRGNLVYFLVIVIVILFGILIYYGIRFLFRKKPAQNTKEPPG